ncbi:MAG TPA: hypothetical protein VGM67_08780 [Gemmatimonadaceae bacterium]|jgi:hypothetical protein
MLDIIYVASTIAFFGAMLAYVRLCDVLGRRGVEARNESSRSEAQHT